MIKWLILFGAGYLIYRGLVMFFRDALGKGAPGKVEPGGSATPPAPRYSKDDVIDVEYREVERGTGGEDPSQRSGRD